MRLIRPTLAALTSNRVIDLAGTFRQAEHDPRLDDFFERIAAIETSAVLKRGALNDVAVALITPGITFSQLTPEALLHYGLKNLELIRDRRPSTDNRLQGKTAWAVLCAMGQFPPDTPPTPRACLGQRQLTSEELVDRYTLRNGSARRLLIDYLEHRRQDLDYSTLFGLSRQLVGLFWQQIEILAPDQKDPRIPADVYQQWKAGLRSTLNGGVRKSPEAIPQRCVPSTWTCGTGPLRIPSAGRYGLYRAPSHPLSFACSPGRPGRQPRGWPAGHGKDSHSCQP